MNSQSVARLAPSPTGAQHLGNARTFLIAYWAARAQNARLLLRIEDIDSPRIKPWATQQAINDLAWLGIQHDGDPIIQTQRVALYQEVLDQLIRDDRVYPCVCTRKDIEEAASAPHETPSLDRDMRNSTTEILAETTVYPGTCSTWSHGDPMPDAGTYCLRFRVNPGSMTLIDRVAGHVTCDPVRVLGDFPVTRKEGTAAYQLAVVVDDLESRVTEIVRGDDLLASAFRQDQVYVHLNQRSPAYAHVPLVVGEDGRRLAKRHGDTRLSLYREEGVAPHQIVAWAARTTFSHCNWFPRHECDDWSLDRWHRLVIEHFDWAMVNRSRVVVRASCPFGK